jgi:hypothetical protein
MEKERLFARIESMIMSSSKKPKYMSFSTVKVADILGVAPVEVEDGLQEMVREGRLQKSELKEPPHSVIYQLPDTDGHNEPSFVN